METDRKLVVLMLLAVGPLVWLMDGVIDYLFFFDESLIGALFTHVEVHEAYMRGAGAICSIALVATYMILSGRLKHAEKSLQIKRSLLNYGEKIAHIGSWRLDINSNQLIWSDETYRIFGLEPQQMEPSYEDFLAAVHPDDREIVDESYRKAIEERKPYDLIHRIVRPNGEIRVVHERSREIRNPRGGLVTSFGTVHDITVQHRNEQQEQQTKLEQQRLIAQLQSSLDELEGLRTIFPICSHCKQIRNENGDWLSLSNYLEQHSPAADHESCCPSCSRNALLLAAET